MELGYNRAIFDITANQTNQLYTQLKVEENYQQIALIVNASHSIKNITENYTIE
jgi:hypothetical protein